MITIGGQNTPFGFEAIVKNTADETVTFKVLAGVYFANQWHWFPAEHYYGGGKAWTLDAKQNFGGRIGLPGLLAKWGIAALGNDAWLKLAIVESGSLSLWRLKGETWIMEPDRGLAPE